MTGSESNLQTMSLRDTPDYIAPDGSKIRLLPTMKGGDLCHCTLPAGKTSSPVAHQEVEEIWYVVGGEGELWRKNSVAEEIVQMNTGVSLTIPPRTSFQFRNSGDSPLCILIATIPPWPGPNEAVKVAGVWQDTTMAAAKSRRRHKEAITHD